MDDAQQKLFQGILDLGIKPNATEIGRIALKGQIACLVYDPEGEQSMQALNALGWDKRAEVFALSKKAAKQLATADNATKAWVERKSGGRIFVVAHRGTLLVNFEPGKGYWLEDGSTNAEALN